MKSQIYVLIMCLVVSVNAAFAQHYHELASIQSHLESVNGNWKQHQLPVTEIAFGSDNERIQTHLYHVIDLLESTEVKYSRAQLRNRTELISALKNYASEGNFPVNTFHAERTPYFIDVYNTPCAVANLMLHAGNEQLVQELKQEFNYSYIKEMPEEPLLAWAQQHGFETWELALIQPGYSSAPSTRFLPGNLYSSGPVDMVKYDSHNGRTCYSGEIDTLGISSFGCITNAGMPMSFDGLDPFNDEVGGVNDMVVVNDGNYILGGFFENEYGIVIMDGQEVEAYLDITDGFATHALELVGNLLYFDVVDYNAIGSPTQVLSADLSTNPWEIDTIANLYGRVADLLYVDGTLHIAGILTFIDYGDSTVACDNYVVYSNEILSTDSVVFEGLLGSKTLEEIDGSIYLAGDCTANEDDTATCLMVKTNGVWNNYRPKSSNIFPGTSYSFDYIEDIIEFDDRVLVSGKISSSRGSGVFTFLDSTFSAYAKINGEVTSMAFDQNEALVVAGNFRSYTYSNGGSWTLSTQPIQYIGVKVDTLVGVDELEEVSVKVYPNPATDILTADLDRRIESAQLFNAEARHISADINLSGKSLTASVGDLPAGMYYLEISDESGNRYRKEVIVN